MSRQYLNVPYRSKDAAKALGARFDGTVKRWYVEAGIDLVAFGAWVPGTASAGSGFTDVALADMAAAGMATVKKGISLSRLLSACSLIDVSVRITSRACVSAKDYWHYAFRWNLIRF